MVMAQILAHWQHITKTKLGIEFGTLPGHENLQFSKLLEDLR